MGMKLLLYKNQTNRLGLEEEISILADLFPCTTERTMTEQANNDNTSAPVAETATESKALPGLGSLFAAAASANSRKGDTPKKGKTGDQHEQRIGMPPRNTRRSMGKR
tara:strand:+ start:43719 stop:44042 length:324 start_codon:yes stop_codon:yes gene_type:complete